MVRSRFLSPGISERFKAFKASLLARSWISSHGAEEMDSYSCVSSHRRNAAFDYSNPGIASSSGSVYIWALTFELSRELTDMILGKLGGSGWASSNHDLSMDKAVTSKVVGPNLTACHPSFGSPDLIVYCCPPGFESPVLFVDFQFPLTVKFGEFSGIFVHIPKGVGFRERDHGGDIVRRKTVLELGVSEQLKDLEVDTDESIWITSLPRTAAAATIEGIRIEYIK
ncbi:Uncharacterized protein TCM_006867 [Theobroma cacao]|uniref:Polyphenol oxidase C-terminal domain-containing protein n=1 Tax=Theobroma cacao TaxID=3641 RepID=A0A061DYY1_THECC|nr:Uncharacterized protein TCM_006867 [Theobroma cacao]